MTRVSPRSASRYARHGVLFGALLVAGIGALPALADTVSGDQGTANRTLSGSGTTWDLSNATFTQSGYNGGDIPIRITGSNLTINGGKVTGDYPSSLTWWDLKDPNSQYYANGAAYQVDPGSTGSLTFNNGWGKNIAVDLFRTQSPDLAGATFNRPYSETVRDDIFSLSRRDDGTTSYKINDALVEGYTGISWRNTGPGAGKPFNLTINGMVMHIKPQALSSGSCSKWAGGDGNKVGNGSPFKMDSFKGTPSRFLVKDTVIWLEEGNRDACTHDWPDATFQNVTVVWTGPGSFPGTIPAGMKLTTDKSVYDAARTAWFNRAGSAPAPAPTTSASPAPSPVASPSASPNPSPSPSATTSPAPATSPSATTSPAPATSPAATSSPAPVTSTTQLKPTAETASFKGSGDIADDPAIWVNPTAPAKSLVIGTNKADSGGGLGVFDLSGKQLSYYGGGQMNNVDLRTVDVAGVPTVVVAATNRTDKTIELLKLDTATGRLSSIAARALSTGMDPYGVCMYQGGGKLYTFATAHAGGEVDQFEMVPSGSLFDMRKVRTLKPNGVTEGCVADDELGQLYLSEEAHGLTKYGAAPSAGTTHSMVLAVGTHGLTADVEGVTIAKNADGTGYVIVSSQGSSNYKVLRREGDNAWVKSFKIVDGNGIDGTSETDGIDVTTTPLGAAFPDGMLVAHDHANDGGTTSNFKLVNLGDLLG